MISEKMTEDVAYLVQRWMRLRTIGVEAVSPASKHNL